MPTWRPASGRVSRGDRRQSTSSPSECCASTTCSRRLILSQRLRPLIARCRATTAGSTLSSRRLDRLRRSECPSENDRHVPVEIGGRQTCEPRPGVALELGRLFGAEPRQERTLVVVELVIEVRLHRPRIAERLLVRGSADEPGFAQLVGGGSRGADVAGDRLLGLVGLVDLEVVDRFVELFGGAKGVARVAV